MDAQVFQVEAAILAVPIVGVVIGCSRWLVVSEKAFPREFFPVTKSDRFRGVLWGLVIGATWAAGDIALNRLWHRPIWDPGAWERRFAMFVLFVISGRLTFVEIFRVIRCRSDFPPSNR